MSRYLGVIFIAIHFSSIINAQNFKRLGIEEGLSSNTVEEFCQDNQGFIWIATENGLNRFDGYSFKTFFYTKNDTNGILDNRIYSVYEDKEYKLWIGFNNGLQCYNKEKSIFTRYPYPDGNFYATRCIYEDSRGNLWIGTYGGGLYSFSRESNRLIKAPYNEISHVSINDLFEDKNGNIWIGTEESDIWIIDRNSRNLQSFNEFASLPKAGVNFEAMRIRSINEDIEGNIWIAGYANGITIFDPLQSRIIEADALGLPALPSMAMKVIKGSDNNMWIGFDGGGLLQFNPKLKEYRWFNYDVSNKYSLGSNAVRTLFEDARHNLWIGAYNGGISIININANEPFKYLRYAIEDNKSLPITNVTSILKAADNRLWIGTDGGGLIHYSTTTRKAEKVKIASKGLNYSAALCALKDKTGNMWFGFYQGNYIRIDANTDHIQTFPIEGSVNPANDIRCMIQDKNGYIWYGTNGAGVFCIDASNRVVLHLEKKYDSNNPAIAYNYIRSLYQDSKGYIWIGTTVGLTRYNPKTNDFVNFYEKRDDANSLNSNYIFSIVETSKGLMCFATTGGLCVLQTPVWDEKYDKLLGYDNSAIFKNFTTIDGLPDPSVYSVIEDNQQHLWIGTGKGLSMLDLQTLSFKNYAIEGSFSEVFNTGACYKDASGCLYFGSLRGLVYFYPDSISVTTEKQNVVITDIKVNFESIINNKNDHFTGNELVMKADERAINVEFSALEMLYPNTIKYQYKLDGFDENWNLTDASRRYATYTNLNPGYYTLLIKATNKNGVWMEKPAQMTIFIKPPFWKTIWFYFLSLIAVFSILYGTYRYRVAAIQRRNNQLEVLVKNRTEELIVEREKQKIQELENKEILLKQKELEAENLKAEKELIQLKNEKLQHEIEIQNLEVEKKNGELVSAAVQISQKIEFLARLKNSLAQVLEKTTTEKHEMISALIKQIEKDADIRKEWEQFEQHFNQANNNFLKVLKERYPDLTPLDLRICGYLRMNLSNKEIAALHNISLSGVEKSRFRLRKKLRLDNNENIVSFLMGLS